MRCPGRNHHRPTSRELKRKIRGGTSPRVERLERVLAGAAHGADPRRRDVLERGAGWNPAIRISLRWIIDVAARLADPLLHDAVWRCLHGIGIEARSCPWNERRRRNQEDRRRTIPARRLTRNRRVNGTHALRFCSPSLGIGAACPRTIALCRRSRLRLISPADHLPLSEVSRPFRGGCSSVGLRSSA